MKWKSIKDQKPKNGQTIYGCNENIVYGFFCKYYEELNCFYDQESGIISKPLAITHWIALPKTVAEVKATKQKENPEWKVQFCKPNEEQKEPKKRGRKPKRKA